MSDDIQYQVVMNHEHQYSIWSLHQALPLGWNPAGKQGSKQECLAYIDEVWVDLTPLSVRQATAVTA